MTEDVIETPDGPARPGKFGAEGWTLLYEPPGSKLSEEMPMTPLQAHEDLLVDPECSPAPEWEDA